MNKYGRDVSNHHCHVPGCKVKTKPEMLMCFKHWKEVPKHLQAGVWATYRRGQCEDMRPSERWMTAANAAIKSVYQRPITGKIEGKNMLSKIALRKFFIAISSAFSELASEFDAESIAAGNEELKSQKTKKEATKKEATKKEKSGPVPASEEPMEEVESPYTETETEETQEEEDDFAGMEEPKEEVKAPTVEELRTALVKYAEKHGKDKAYAILKKYKAAKANEVKASEIGKVIKDLKV